MVDAEVSPGRLLLVGPLPSEEAVRLGRQARENGWQTRRADDGFAAVEAVLEDATLEAVLMELEPLGSRAGALAEALHSVRPDLPVYLVCPPHLEPDAMRASGELAHVDYLIGPLGASDWGRIRRAARAPDAFCPPVSVEPTPEARPAKLTELDELLDRLHGPTAALLASAAAWASATLGGRTVRIRWVGQSALHPSDAADPPASRTWPLLGLDNVVVGELVVAAAPESAGQGAESQVAGTLGRLLTNRQRLSAFRHMAFTDPLSGAFNRRYLMLFLERLIARAQREHFRITLLMFDIDDFKHYNDLYGHTAGDEIIDDIVRLMRQCSRPSDVVARIGGDEFAVLFWDSGPPRQAGSSHPREAAAVVHRFRRALAGHQFHSLGPEAQGTLTISGGLANYPANASDAEGLLAAAAAGLKTAKQSGKNRLYVVGPEPPSLPSANR